MSTLKATPGPWSTKTWRGARNIGGVADADGRRIAIASLSHKSTDETIANAALISAAPDLYAVANEAYEFLREMLERGGKSDGHGSPADLLANRIADALVKAEGKS